MVSGVLFASSSTQSAHLRFATTLRSNSYHASVVVGVMVHFWTDVEEYYHFTLDVLGAHTGLKGPRTTPEARAEHDMDYRTHFERRVRKHGEPIYRAEFSKPPS